jgi:hypothetical protein
VVTFLRDYHQLFLVVVRRLTAGCDRHRPHYRRVGWQIATGFLRITGGWASQRQPDFWVLPLVLLARLGPSRQIKRCHKGRAVIGDKVSQVADATLHQIS